MLNKIMGIVKEVSENIEFDHESDLFAKGIIDSFAVVTIVSEIENHFQIELEAEEIIPENFQTVDAIVALLDKKLK